MEVAPQSVEVVPGRSHPIGEPPSGKVKDKLREMAEQRMGIKKKAGETVVRSTVDPSAILVPSAEWQGVDWSEVPDEELNAQLQSPPRRAKTQE